MVRLSGAIASLNQASSKPLSSAQRTTLMLSSSTGPAGNVMAIRLRMVSSGWRWRAGFYRSGVGVGLIGGGGLLAPPSEAEDGLFDSPKRRE